MPERVFTYDFRGRFTNLTAGLATAGKATQDFGNKLTALDRNGQKMRAGLTQLGSTAGRFGLVAAAGLAVAVRAAANFDQAMSRVQAATHETAANMDLLRAAAIQTGQDTVFSASEAAQAEEELAKAGISTADILGGALTGAVSLAAAGTLDVADAAEIAASAMVQFGLSGKDVPHIADLLAAGAGKAQGSVQDLGYALKYAGVPAASLGISIEETTGVLAEFASAGIVGEQAGTTLRAMLVSLAAPTKLAQKTMDQYGLSLYDANGKFIGVQAAAQQLQDKLGPLSEAERNHALNQIFTNAALQGAIKLYQGGGAAVAAWTDKVDDSGYAADTAALKMDNLRGDLEQLRGSLETALIGLGEGSQSPLRTLVQGLTDTVNAFNDLPGPAKTATLALLGLSATLGGGVWTTGKVVAGMASTRQALQDLGMSAASAERSTRLLARSLGAAAGVGTFAVGLENSNKALGTFESAIGGAIAGFSIGGPWGAAIGGATGAIVSLGVAHRDTAGYVDALTASLDKQTGALTADAINTATKELEKLGALKTAENLGLDLGLVTDAALGSADALATLNDEFAKYANVDTPTGVDVELFKQREAYRDLLKTLTGLAGDSDSAIASFKRQKEAADEATGAVEPYTSSVKQSAAANQEAADAVNEAVKAMTDQKDAAVKAFDAVTNYRQAVKDAAEQAKKSDDGIAGSTDDMLANRNALSQLISAWNSLDSTVTDNVGKFKQARDNFIQTATAMGVPKDAAIDLWQQMAKIPSSKVITFSTPGADQATEKAKTLKQYLDALKNKDIYIALHYQTIGNRGPTGGAPLPGSPNGRASEDYAPGVTDRLRRAGVDTVTPRAGDLAAQAEAKAAYALSLLARESQGAAHGSKGLKDRLHDLENRLDKVSKAADKAHDTLDSLRSQRADLAASVSQSLTHNPFGGSLSDFAAQVQADAADAQAMLAALSSLVQNGVDPHSAFFQQLAASGNVSLVQQFAALTRGELANYAASFAAQQSAATAAGQFAGNSAFNDAIRAQVKVTQNLDSTVHHLAQEVKHLQQVLDHMPSGRGGGGRGGGGSRTRELTRTGSR